jgi:membrane-associated protein
VTSLLSSLVLSSSLLNPEKIIEKGGLLVLVAIVFAESGLLIGFFLPGDSLLFIAGFLASDAGGHKLPALPIVLLCVAAAAILGDQVGYLFGKRVGPALFNRPDSRLFKQQHVVKAHKFFDKHGSKTIVMARFVPIVRTFAPIVAGVGEMKYRTFLIYNVIGGVLWGVGVTTLGYLLGDIGFIKNNIDIALIAIVAISLVPVAIEFWRHRRAIEEEVAEILHLDD